MSYLQAVILGIVEGLTEFLPVSSTGHLTITEKILGLPLDDPSITAYTAVIQMGAIAAVLIYFFSDIWRIAVAWFKGLFRPEYRGHFDHRFGWFVIAGTLPIGIVGFLLKDVISGPLRSLWWVGGSLVVWSAAMWWAEKHARQDRGERQLTLRDSVMIGLAQCLALVPGVSRSGATISAGLALGLDRVTATRLSFFLSIPALTAAGLYELKDVVGSDIGIGQTVVGTLVSFIVAYASVAWLLRFVAHHPITWFVPYRVLLGGGILVLLGTGVMQAT
ncbi:MAG: undecaprenyl-diphosphate phosphatase [Nocardioidaceae bacterium]|nr:undecaprenyl-diphosphate phosphatase [Nocardioidaceae bacterium]